jgi:hypothetical protein
VKQRTEAWSAFVERMPAVVKDALGTDPWEDDQAGFEGPVEEVPLDALVWLLDLPIWGWRGTPFQVTPNQVRADPNTYAIHHARVMWSDLEDPIHLAERNGRWVVLDGYHRLLKAVIEQRPTIRALRRRRPGSG